MARIITHWWGGYDSDIIPPTHRPVRCDYCNKNMGTYVPREWPKIEIVCRECELE